MRKKLAAKWGASVNKTPKPEVKKSSSTSTTMPARTFRFNPDLTKFSYLSTYDATSLAAQLPTPAPGLNLPLTLLHIHPLLTFPLYSSSHLLSIGGGDRAWAEGVKFSRGRAPNGFSTHSGR